MYSDAADTLDNIRHLARDYAPKDRRFFYESVREQLESLISDVPRLVRPLSDAEILSGKLLAFIKVNHKRGTFAVCTDEQLAAHLKPFEDELNSIKANANCGGTGEAG